MVSRVLKMIDDPALQTRALEHVIESDPAITAKVLKVANSSYYGHGEVPSISRAIALLGLNTVRSLSVNVAYQQMVGGRPQAVKFSKLEFWRHSLAVGTCAKVLAR